MLAVHDEIVVECDEDKANATEKWLKKAMLDALAPDQSKDRDLPAALDALCHAGHVVQ